MMHLLNTEVTREFLFTTSHRRILTDLISHCVFHIETSQIPLSGKLD